MNSMSNGQRLNTRVKAPFLVRIAGREFKIHDFSLRGLSIQAPGIIMKIGEIFAGSLCIPMKQGETPVAV